MLTYIQKDFHKIKESYMKESVGFDEKSDKERYILNYFGFLSYIFDVLSLNTKLCVYI